MKATGLNKWFPLALLLGQLLASGAPARDTPFPDEQDPSMSGGFVEPEPWMEQEFQLPPFPNDSDLLRIEPMRPDPQFDYLVDRKTLSVGEDGVVRYTLVISAKQGNARNLRVEGIRCGTSEYRTYAYGTEQGTFKPARRSTWARIRTDPSDRIRADLKRYYFCKEGHGRPFPRTKILHYLRVGGDSGGHRFLFE